MWDREFWIKKAEENKPEIKHEKIYPVENFDKRELHTGDSIVMDFGNHYVGHFSFHGITAGSPQDAPVFLKLKFCESKRELSEDSTNYHGWISRGWIQEEWLHIDVLPAEIRMPRRYAFRYVKIDIVDVSSKFSLIIDDAYVDAVTSADDSVVEKFDGNEIEKAIDKVSIRTLRNCMQDVFEDGPKRDRRLWIGDLRLQALTNAATYKDYDLVKRCLYLFAGCTDDNGRVTACIFTKPEIIGDDTYMFDYSLFFIACLEDYVRFSKDYETGKDLLKVAIRQWELSSNEFDSNEVINDRNELGWCFIDWNLTLNKQAAAQFVYIFSLKKLVALMEILGETEFISEINEDIERKSKAAIDYFYDSDKKIFTSGEEKQISYATQSWAVIAEVLSEEENREVLQAVNNDENALKMVTPYMNHVYVEALMKAGMKKEAYNHMIYYWGGMIEDGADTFYELFNPEDPDESPYGSSIVNSYCHAWSCTPAYFMRLKSLKEGIV